MILLVNQLDFLSWIFETAIFDYFKNVGLELNHELGYKFYYARASVFT